MGAGPGAAVVDLPGEAVAGRWTGGGTKRPSPLPCTATGADVFLDPYTGTQGCVAAAARRVAAAGAQPAAITNGLNFGSPQRPHMYWQLERCLAGMADACRALNTPVTGGNASLFNETDGRAVQPTPIIGMVGVLESADKALPAGFQRAGNVVLLLGETKDGTGRQRVRGRVARRRGGFGLPGWTWRRKSGCTG